MRQANFVIDTGRSTPSILFIKDLGPWDQFPTVTNDAEGVVERLFKSGALKEGMRLQYGDSDRQVDEILIKDKKFSGFASQPYEEVGTGKIDEGGQAFPRSYAYLNPETGQAELKSSEGMTRRQWLAGMAMNGLVKSTSDTNVSKAWISRTAWSIADVMIMLEHER